MSGDAHDDHDAPAQDENGGILLMLIWGVPLAISAVIVIFGIAFGGFSQFRHGHDGQGHDPFGFDKRAGASTPAAVAGSMQTSCPMLRDHESHSCTADGSFIPVSVSASSAIHVAGAPCGKTVDCRLTDIEGTEHGSGEQVKNITGLRFVPLGNAHPMITYYAD